MLQRKARLQKAQREARPKNYETEDSRTSTKLIKELINGDISEASKYGGWLTFAYAITQFLFAPVIGNLSDKFGRRPIILISLFAFSLD